ncbi:MAG: GNAT family N-acetyltransferase [Rhodoluna sp.]|nr:GNAT family N-acetyltransferase [Rhodoluna sp.]
MMILRLPTLADEKVLRLADSELELDGSNFLLDGFQESEADFQEYLGRVHSSLVGENLLPGRVPSTFLVAVVDGEIVGRTSIRHELNEWLTNFGGHIGYAVRPGFRRRGYATEILSQSLVIASSLGIANILMTCNDDNVASIRIIEKHGGALENKVDQDGVLLRRYWIDNV